VFDHIGIGVSSLERARPLSSKRLLHWALFVMDFSHAVGLGRGQKPSFWLGATDDKPVPLQSFRSRCGRKR
jgi:hypothetical protein